VTGFDHAFLSGAYRRIQIAIAVITVCVTLGAGLQFGLRAALGVTLGGAIAFVNFAWLKQSMIGLTDRFAIAVQRNSQPNTPRVMLRFFARYAAIAIVAYATIASSAVSPYGVMAGLLLSVPALLFEAMYEIWRALRYQS
jgi:hypothetical protein